MDIKAIKHEIATLPLTQLQAVRNILEFNLRGILIGNRAEVALKLGMVEIELKRRKLQE